MGRKKSSKLLEPKGEEGIDIDLTPVMSFMVTLIPIMLLSTVFVKVTLIETQLPQIVQQAVEADRNKKQREVTYEVELSHGKGFTVLMKEDGSVKYRKQLPRKGDEWDLNGLQSELVRLKEMRPDIFRLEIKPSSEVAYEEIVKVIDEARTIKDKNRQVSIKDSKSDKVVKTDVMFPDVVFADVVGG